MRVSTFENLGDNKPKILEMSWAVFTASLRHNFSYHPDAKDKGALPLFSPADYPPGKIAKKDYVRALNFGVLDLDHVTADQLLTVIECLEGISAVLYSTWSHSKHLNEHNLWCVRICIEFSRPIVGKEWPLFWPKLINRFKAPADPKCKNADRRYYGAFAPPGTEKDAQYALFEGEPLDVDTLKLASPIPVQGTERIPRDRLERLAVRWKRSRDDYRANMGVCLERVCRGEPFAEDGNVDNLLFQLCSDLAEAFPAADSQSIAAHFAQSLQLMSYGGKAPHTVEDVAAKIQRASQAKAEEQAAQEEERLTEQRLRIRQAFAHIDPTRDWPYSNTDLDDMCTKLRCTRDELTTRWIIQRGKQFYILGPGAVYSDPYTDTDVMNALIRDLSPARTAGVELWGLSEARISFRKQIQQLMSEYGTVATQSVLDLRAQEAVYEPSQKLFIEAPCPLRKLTPTYDQDVATWLEIMCGDHLNAVNTWLALVTSLDETCAALMLTGPKGAGKSLFAHGVSRLWRTSGPVAMTSAMDPAFNEALAKCPLAFADEQLPKDWKGNGRTAELREFIAARTRPYKRKWAHETVMLGATRTIIAANNEDILAIAENLSVNDIEAISDRFYHVRINDRPVIIDGHQILDVAGQPMSEPAYFLTLVDAPSFVYEDKLAKHALWLKDNHPIVRKGRFLIKSPDRSFYRALTTKSGIRSAICQWLTGYIREPTRVDAGRDYRVRISQKRLLVTTQGILDNWSLYVSNVIVPETGRLSNAIAGLSRTKRVHMSVPNRQLKYASLNYREIDIDHVIAWAQETEFATEEDIRSSLAIDTEQRLPTLQIGPRAN